VNATAIKWLPIWSVNENNQKTPVKKWYEVCQCEEDSIFNQKSPYKKGWNDKKNWLTVSHNWNRTIFSDEKRFTLDDSDNWMNYVAKDSQRCRQKHQCKGIRTTAWLMIMPNGLITYKLIDDKFRSAEYMQLLQNTVVPICKLNYESNFYF